MIIFFRMIRLVFYYLTMTIDYDHDRFYEKAKVEVFSSSCHGHCHKS